MLRRLTGDLARTLPRTSGSEKPDNDANANHDDRDRGDKAGPRKQGGESDGTNAGLLTVSEVAARARDDAIAAWVDTSVAQEIRRFRLFPCGPAIPLARA
jgi:hypothetical protein